MNQKQMVSAVASYLASELQAMTLHELAEHCLMDDAPHTPTQWERFGRAVHQVTARLHKFGGRP